MFFPGFLGQLLVPRYQHIGCVGFPVDDDVADDVVDDVEALAKTVAFTDCW